MRKISLRAFLVLAFLILAAVAVWADTGSLAPVEPGQVFTVINYKRAEGRAQPTSVTVTSGTLRKSKTVIPPYRRCDTTVPAGFVLKLRIQRPSSEPLTVSTNGTLVRGPFSGEMPLEVLHACYKLVLF